MLAETADAGKPESVHSASRIAGANARDSARKLAAAGVVAEVRQALATPGQPLDPSTREQMQGRLTWDFGAVRIHSGERAARSARGLGAAAYTVGSQIVLGPGHPGLSTPGGQRLLAHELAHVVQQGATRARPRGVAPIAGPEEAAAARGSVRPGAVAAGTIQRSALSDKVRLQAGLFPTLTSVLAALSGDDVLVSDPDLDQAISDLLGGRAEDIALAQQVRSRELGTTKGWAGPAGTGSRKSRSITARYVPGRTGRRALVIAGVHGTEVQGVEVAEQLIADLSAPGNQAEMSAIIVPDLFPDDAAYRSREGPGAHPNRNFPDPAKGLAGAGIPPKDALGKDIRPENVLLLQLIDRFKPERIISIHGTWDPAMAGVSYDPRTPAVPGDRDERLALDAADLVDARASKGAAALPGRGKLKHASAAGNFTGTATKADYARWKGAMEPGVSLGGYASQRGISIFTVEPPDNNKIDEFRKGAARSAREVEIKAYAEAVRTILLGS